MTGFLALCVRDLLESIVSHRSHAWPPPLRFRFEHYAGVVYSHSDREAILDVHDILLCMCV